jgi:hypothetical protein
MQFSLSFAEKQDEGRNDRLTTTAEGFRLAKITHTNNDSDEAANTMALRQHAGSQMTKDKSILRRTGCLKEGRWGSDDGQTLSPFLQLDLKLRRECPE